ncbi:MAG: hypothetical protein ACRD8A_03420 [Candidatus Acidiferrales bacterium]
MFCPSCKAEYRQGFTRCSDCDVDLVSHLPTDVPTNAIREEDRDRPTLLWTGTSREAQSALCTGLEEANIAYQHQEKDVGIIPGLEQPVYAVFVKQLDLNGAQFVLEGVAQHFESADPEADAGDGLVAQRTQADDGDFTPVPDDIPRDFNPEDATEAIWSGADSEMAETVRVCLRENGIGCVVKQTDNQNAVLVIPHSEARAREIVNEIVRGTPTP